MASDPFAATYSKLSQPIGQFPNIIKLDADSNPPIITAVPNCRVTWERPQATHVSRKIHDPAIARANAAVSTEAPHGTAGWAEEHKDSTVLQQHVLFFDRDNDQVIWPIDTYVGFRDLGFNILFSLAAMVIIHLSLSYATQLSRTWIPDPFCRIYTDAIHKDKHGSDSGVFDREGRFVPQAFEDMFAQIDKDGDGAFSFTDLRNLVARNRLLMDPFGWTADFLEWGTVYLLLQKNGLVSKDDIRRCLDGSIFYEIRRERQKGDGWDKGYGFGGDWFLGGKKVF